MKLILWWPTTSLVSGEEFQSHSNTATSSVKDLNLIRHSVPAIERLLPYCHIGITHTNYHICCYQVSDQPLYFIDKRVKQNTSRTGSFNSTTSEGVVLRYNLRKLNEMPYHLVKSRRFNELNDMVLFNFKWLYAKLSAMSVQSVLEDYEEALANAKSNHHSIKLVMDSLKLSASVIEHHPNMLAPQLIGRLLPLYSQYSLLRGLLRQCDSDGIAFNALTPCYNCFQTPGGPLEISLEGHQFAPFGISITSDNKFLVTASNKFIVWDLSKMQMVRQASIGTLGIVMQMTLTSDDVRAVAYTNSGQILVYTVLTGRETWKIMGLFCPNL